MTPQYLLRQQTVHLLVVLLDPLAFCSVTVRVLGMVCLGSLYL